MLLTQDRLPFGLMKVHLMVAVMGRQFQKSFPAFPDLSYTFIWDKTDAYNQKVFGLAEAVGEYPLWSCRLKTLCKHWITVRYSGYLQAMNLGWTFEDWFYFFENWGLFSQGLLLLCNKDLAGGVKSWNPPVLHFWRPLLFCWLLCFACMIFQQQCSD